MACLKCGYASRSDAKFCSKCGARIESQEVIISLDTDDEFYGENLIQISGEEGGRSVTHKINPVTNSLLVWWRDGMGQPDIVDISDNNLNSTLSFSDTIQFPSIELNQTDVTIVFEVDEQKRASSLYVYSTTFYKIDVDHVEALYIAVGEINSDLLVGSLQIIKGHNSSEYTVRYAWTALFSGVKVGKPNLVQTQYEVCKYYAGLAFSKLEQRVE